jgi:hypothetical protein
VGDACDIELFRESLIDLHGPWHIACGYFSSSPLAPCCLDSGDPAHVRLGPRPLSDLLEHAIPCPLSTGYPFVGPIWSREQHSCRGDTSRYTPQAAVFTDISVLNGPAECRTGFSQPSQGAIPLPFHTDQFFRCIAFLTSMSPHASAFHRICDYDTCVSKHLSRIPASHHIIPIPVIFYTGLFLLVSASDAPSSVAVATKLSGEMGRGVTNAGRPQEVDGR